MPNLALLERACASCFRLSSARASKPSARRLGPRVSSPALLADLSTILGPRSCSCALRRCCLSALALDSRVSPMPSPGSSLLSPSSPLAFASRPLCIHYLNTAPRRDRPQATPAPACSCTSLTWHCGRGSLRARVPRRAHGVRVAAAIAHHTSACAAEPHSTLRAGEDAHLLQRPLLPRQLCIPMSASGYAPQQQAGRRPAAWAL